MSFLEHVITLKLPSMLEEEHLEEIEADVAEEEVEEEADQEVEEVEDEAVVVEEKVVVEEVEEVDQIGRKDLELIECLVTWYS